MTSVASILVPDELKKGCSLPRKVTMNEESMTAYHLADNHGEPEFKSLMNLVVAEIPSLWYDVGIQLSIPIGILDGFKVDTNLGGLSKNCFRETLLYWCRNFPSPYKWSVLLSSLASPSVGQKRIADKIFKGLMEKTAQENTHNSPDSLSSDDIPFVQRDVDDVKPLSDNEYLNQDFPHPDLNRDSRPELEEANSETSGTASVETMTFMCGCGKCTIDDFLDGEIGCKNPGCSIGFPLLDTSSLSPEKQMHMIDKLNSEAEEIDDEFAYLASEIASSFHERSIELTKLKVYLSNIEYIKVRALSAENREQQLLSRILDKIKNSQSVAELFILLQEFWSWFNYRLLERLLKRFGNCSEKHLLEEYVSKLKHFLQRYVYEMPSSIHSPKSLNNFTKFRAKLSDEMKSAKAEELPMIQAGLARVLGIEAHALILTTITHGCVELEFLAPEIIEMMFPLSNEIFDEMHKLEWKICRVQCGNSEPVNLRPIDDKDSAEETVPPLPQVQKTDDDQHSVTSGSSGISGSIATEITNTNESSLSIATKSESGYSGSIPEKQGSIKKPDDQLRRQNLKGIHDICQVCLMNNPYDDSLIEDSCHDTQHHDGVYPLICATWDEEENILVPIRPLPPQMMHLNGFALCNGEWCRGETCTYAHSDLEKMAWNFELNKNKRTGRSNTSTQLPALLCPIQFAPFCPQMERQSHVSNPKQIIRFTVNRKENYAAYNKWKGKFTDRRVRAKLKDEEELELSLTSDNYQEKFYVLLCFEEMEHIDILTKNCDGKYEVEMFDSVPDWMKRLPYEKPRFVGCIKGMTGNQIAYATQSSEGLYFVDYRNDDKDVCRASILSCNFYTVEKVMYFSLITRDAIRLRKCFGSTPCICDIEFEVKHGFFDALHKAVISIPNYVILKLMPQIDLFQAIPDSELQAECIHDCLEVASGSQLTALQVICASSSRIPILVSGPFGSGKTRILARAAYEFAMDGLRKHNTTRILICAHHPASTQTYITDYFGEIAILDHKWRREVKVVRITRGMFQRDSHYNSYFRNLSQFSHEISEEKYLHEKCLVIVTTYMTSLQLLSIIKRDDWFFTHILLDEAAQVREPEAVAPLCLAGRETKIVIAGDSKQVGPALVVLGQQAHENGLAVSLLERLQQKYKEYGGHAEQYQKILTDGYRCNHEITEFLSTLFYDRKVKSRVQEPIHPRAKFPFVFYCCDVDRMVRAPQEPAFDAESDAVLQQLKFYFWPRNWGEQNLNELSVITPTRNQVNLIRKKLDQKLKNVNVLPTYMIQGHEFRCVFLSTCEPLEQDGRSQDPLKSLCNPHVFNTAISRAKSLVVAIGNPFMLLKIEEVMGSRRRCWREYLRLCLKHNTVFFPDNYKLDNRTKLIAQIEAAVGMESQKISPFLVDKEHESKPSVLITPPGPPKFVKDFASSPDPNRSYADVAKASTNIKRDNEKKYKTTPVIKKLAVKDDDEINVSSSESDSESESREQYLERIKFL